MVPVGGKEPKEGLEMMDTALANIPTTMLPRVVAEQYNPRSPRPTCHIRSGTGLSLARKRLIRDSAGHRHYVIVGLSGNRQHTERAYTLPMGSGHANQGGALGGRNFSVGNVNGLSYVSLRCQSHPGGSYHNRNFGCFPSLSRACFPWERTLRNVVLLAFGQKVLQRVVAVRPENSVFAGTAKVPGKLFGSDT